MLTSVLATEWFDYSVNCRHYLASSNVGGWPVTVAARCLRNEMSSPA
jgi:hypothetical protein